MPYKDPIKARENGRLRTARWRDNHPERYKSMQKVWNRKAWERHGDKYKVKNKERYENNKEKYLKQQKEYKRLNKEKLNEYDKEKNKRYRRENPNFLIKSRLRCLLYNSVKLYGNGAKVQKSRKYGLDLYDIAKHLVNTQPKDFDRSKFHIDHIQAVSKFNLTNPEEVRKAFDKSNLQWLPAKDNIRKSNK